MAIKYVSLCFALMVSVEVCLAGPTTTPAPVVPSFNDILQTAQSTVNSAKSHVEHMLGLPELKNVDQVVAAMRNASTDFSKKVTDVLATVKVEALAPIQKQTESLFRNFSQSLADIKKDLGRYNASAGTELILHTVESYLAKINGQLEKEREILSRVEFKQFQDLVVNSSASLVQQGVKAYEDVKKKVDPNAKDAAAAIQKFYTEINKTTEELRKKIPDLQATELEKVWSKSLNSIIEEGTKLQNSLLTEAPHAQESMTKAAQSILESAMKAANAFADQVHEAVGHDKYPDHVNHHKA